MKLDTFDFKFISAFLQPTPTSNHFSSHAFKLKKTQKTVSV